MVNLGWTSNPTTSMSSDSSYTEFHDSLGESASYPLPLAHTLFNRQSLPGCTSRCFSDLSDLGGCLTTDHACLCKNEAFVSSTAACIEKSCTGPDLAAAISTSEQLCLSAGVTLSAVPTGSTTTSAIPSTGSNSVNRKSTVMIGPIVGGVVGFLALVVLGVGFIWFCKSRGKGVRRVSSLTSAELSPILPSSIVEPFPFAAPQNSGQLQSSNKPISSGGLPASPSMKQVEATRSLIPSTTQTPSLVQKSSSSASTPISGLYTHAMTKSGSRTVLHQDSGIRLLRQLGEDEVVGEMPPLYTPS